MKLLERVVCAHCPHFLTFQVSDRPIWIPHHSAASLQAVVPEPVHLLTQRPGPGPASGPLSAALDLSD